MKKVLIALVVIIAGLVAFIAMRPGKYEVERSTEIAAPVDVPFALVSDFHAWGDWSPWEKLDPQMKKTFEGTPGEVGSSYGWVGNDDVGEGRMTLIGIEPNRSADIKLEFIKPWTATSQTTFTFAPQGEQTKVTWKMVGENDFMGKAFSLFADMDKMVGGDFEKGLAEMKSLSETKAKVQREAEAAAPVDAPADAPVQ